MRKRQFPMELPTKVSERSRLLSRVSAWYREAFRGNAQAQAAMKARGLKDGALWEAFQVGLAGTLAATVPVGSELRGQLTALGVFDAKGSETFEGCVVFPWFGEGDLCLGLAGVHLETGKEVHLPGEPIGVWNAGAVRRSRSVILTSSILEALMLYEAGFRQVIPLWGKDGLTQDHRALLGRSGTKAAAVTFQPDAKVLEGLKDEEVAVRMVKMPPLPAPAEVLKGLFPDMNRAPDGLLEKTATGFTAQYGERVYRVKGIEKGPVRMKASVQAFKEGDEEPFHMDVVDLYSHRGRQLFAKGACAVLGWAEATVFAETGKLLTLAEGWEAKPGGGTNTKAMTASEREEALAFLQDPRMLERILEDFAVCGLAGEEGNKLVGYLCTVSRKLDEPLAVLIQSRSAAGKSALQEAVLRFVPPEDYVKYTRLTGQALFYADETGLSHKLIAIEEEAGAREASYSIRNLQSAKFLSIATTEKDALTGKMKAVEYRVKGPVALMLTTTSVDMDYETQNRFLTLTIDESKGMTERILEAQREGETLAGLMKGRERERVERRHQNAQRLLRPLAVVNPYAPKLAFPANALRARRDHKKYLGLIRVIAFLHQYQREVKTYVPGEGEEPVAYVEVEPGDIERANALVGEVLGRTLDEVSAPGRALLGEIRKLAGKETEKRFTRRAIREACGWSDFQVKTHLGELVELEYLYVAEGRKGKEYVYELAVEGGESPRLEGLKAV